MQPTEVYERSSGEGSCMYWPVRRSPYYYEQHQEGMRDLKRSYDQNQWMASNVQIYNRNLLQTQRLDSLLREMNVRDAFWSPRPGGVQEPTGVMRMVHALSLIHISEPTRPY
eukprot:TRINITY_DN5179_c0_g1_i1.p1 TRINITY_DN5179_c0_g1~~TRINITY_DN5179_c0_g1_i1.p1  ORF type:complete len:112 (-),score=29.05 TRINITY_DN5179_c0_g1_i1:75-410(-)